MALHAETLTVLRPQWTVQRGDRIADWAAATAHDIPRCEVQPQSVTEVTSTGAVTRQAVARELRVFAPAGADIDEHDRARYRGELYEVTSVAHWDAPVGRLLAHTDVTLHRIEG
ncbi:MAG: hypothetical protein GEU83_11865 [Pseudonocardiaceae bacterium]|nr:hypothetical protein [Pseudonocardiaceae bacterium]